MVSVEGMLILIGLGVLLGLSHVAAFLGGMMYMVKRIGVIIEEVIEEAEKYG